MQHYLNALVSMQLTLLRDERREEAAGTSNHPSLAVAITDGKALACPVLYAAAAAAAVVGATGQNGGRGGEAAAAAGAGSDEAAWPDEWQEDDEAGVAVLDQSGR